MKQSNCGVVVEEENDEGEVVTFAAGNPRARVCLRGGWDRDEEK